MHKQQERKVSRSEAAFLESLYSIAVLFLQIDPLTVPRRRSVHIRLSYTDEGKSGRIGGILLSAERPCP